MMRRLSRIFLTIAFILGIVLMATLLIAGICLVVVGALPEISGEIAEQSEEGAIAFQAGMISGGVIMIMFGLMALPCAIVSSIAKKRQTRGAFITAIVFGALSCDYFAIAGGVLGILANNQDAKHHVVDAQ